MKTKCWGLSLAGTAVLVYVLAAHGLAQTAGAGQKPAPEVKVVPCAAIVSVEGKDNYAAYCAVCHGADGRGGGPAAPAMKAPVPDLTTIAKRHGGKFDSAAVEYIVRGRGKTQTPAHGTTEMPIWGPALATAVGDPSATTIRIVNLVKYLESIQQGS